MENTTQLSGPGELYSRSWKLYKAHFGMFAAIIAIPLALTYGGTLFDLTHVPILGFVGSLCTLVGAILMIAVYPSLVNAIHRLSSEPATVLTVKGQYKIGFSFFWSFILVAIIVCLSFLGSFVLFLIPGIVVAGYAGVYMFAFVVDGKKGFSALTESYTLVKGRWWGVIGRVLAMALPIWLIVLIFGSVFGLNSVGGHAAPVSITSVIFNLIIGIVVTPFALAYTYNLYSSLKATRLPSVDTKAFKGWLIAFLCVGVVFMIAMPIIVFSSLASHHSPIYMMPRAQQTGTMIPYAGTSTVQ